MSEQGLRLLGLAGWLLSIGLVCATYALQVGVAGNPGLAQDPALDHGYLANLVVVVTTAVLLVWARPRHSVGWLLGLSGALGVLCNAGQTYGAHALVVPGSDLPFGAAALSFTAPLWMLNLVIPATLLLARYPSGRVEGRWARRLDRVVQVALVSTWGAYAVSPESVTDAVTTARPPIESSAGMPVLITSAVTLLVAMLLTTAMAVRRLFRSEWPERPQLALLLAVAPLSVLAVMFSPWGWVGSVFFSAMPVAVVVGVLRYRLMGIQVVVRRTLLYAGLTALVLVVFAAVTAAVALVVPEGPAPTVLAAIAVAVLVVPARDRLQALVDRLVYGDRQDPWRALHRLGRQAVDGTGLADVLQAVGHSLHLPGAEVRSASGTTVTWGEVGEDAMVVPLTLSDGLVGELRVAPRRGEHGLSAADQRLLDALAPLVALVLRGNELTAELEVEREHVLEATAAERARLRRDLHDGLGPSLTGIGLGLEALDSSALPARSRSVLARVRTEVAASLEEVRRIIDDLRPGALETGDLLSVLQARALQLTSTTPVRVEVDAPAELPRLTPGTEVAALRILEEALHNVVRHAGATRCRVSVRCDDELHLLVADDGHGFTGPREGGVGLASMRSRANALGGRLDVESSPAGTALSVALPLGVPA